MRDAQGDRESGDYASSDVQSIGPLEENIIQKNL
jgi:hypothetical protein